MLFISRITTGDLEARLDQIYSPTKPVPGDRITVDIVQPELGEIFRVRPQPDKVNICTHPVRKRCVLLCENCPAADHD